MHEGEYPVPSQEVIDDEIYDKMKNKAVFDQLSDIEKERFDYFRRSVFTEGKIKKILSQNLGITGNPKANRILCSAAKAYVGLLVEEAKMV